MLISRNIFKFNDEYQNKLNFVVQFLIKLNISLKFLRTINHYYPPRNVIHRIFKRF